MNNIFSFGVKKVTTAVLLTAFITAGYCEDGKTIFKSNCAACHTVGKGKLVGPDLKDVHKRHSQEWLIKWIKSSSSMIKSGDADAVALFNENNKIPMTEFAFLSDEQIKSVLDYVKTESESAQTAASSSSPNIGHASASQQTDGIRTHEYIFIILIVFLLLIIWQLSKIIRRLSAELIEINENNRFS